MTVEQYAPVDQSVEVTNQVYWDKALKYWKKNPTNPTAAMQNLYFDWNPPFDPNAFAAIFGALYANRYWAANASEGQKMSVTTLANDISASIGMNMQDARKAATWAFSNWYGLFVRANVNNRGEIPKQGSTTASPDVLVNGLSPLSPRLIIERWNQMTWGPAPNQKNYAYGRAQSLNIGVDITKPELFMRYTDAGFLPPPSSWQQLYTFDDQLDSSPFVNIQGESDLTPGTRAASELAFGANFPGQGHYCLIAMAATEFFDNTPNAGTGNWDSTTWLTNNGAAGWHNIDVVSSDHAGLMFYNHDPSEERFVFEAHCHRLPSGSEIAMGAEEVRPVRARITEPYEVVRTMAELPGDYAGRLEVQLPELPPEASVDFQMHWVVPAGHRNYAQAVEHLGAVGAAENGKPVRLPMGNFTFVGSLGDD